MSPAGAPTPEEKLLRLIRGKAPAVAPVAEAGRAAAPAAPAAAVPRTTAVVRRGRSRKPPWRVPAWWGLALNGVLAVAVIGGFAMTTWLLATPPPVPSTAGRSEAGRPAEAVQPMYGPPGGGGVSSVASSVTRPLFITRAPAAAPGADRSAASQSAQASALVQRLSLIGVVDGDPAQAIIEDAQGQKTYFVTAGQGIIEGLVVDAIQGNRVTLSLGTEKIELSL